MSRRNLVIVRAGDSSLHPQWLTGAQDRSWDLIVNYYGDDALKYPESADGMKRIDSKGPKWPALHALLSQSPEIWQKYDYVWLPDDDLAATPQTIELMFQLMQGLDLHLAQPSLSWTSYVSLVMTLHNPNFAVRYSSFVEPMAPCFSRRLLERVLPTFNESISGWGLDYVWPRYLDSPYTQCAILDGIQVTHTRPVGGPNYRFNRDAGVNPMEEMHRLLRKHGVPYMQLSFGAIDKSGRRYNLFDDSAEKFVYQMCAGYAPKLGSNTNGISTVFSWHWAAIENYRKSGDATMESAIVQSVKPKVEGVPPMATAKDDSSRCVPA